MSHPRRVASYPRQLVALALEFERAGGTMLRCSLGSPLLARQIRGELWGLRRAIEREGLGSDWPVFLSSRIYLGAAIHLGRDFTPPGWIDPPLAPDEIAIVGADYLPWARALDVPKELS